MLFILSYTTPMSRNTSGNVLRHFLTFSLVVAIKELNFEEDKPWEQRIYSL